MKKRKAILSVILTLAMLLSTITPVSVFAASEYTVSLASSKETVNSGETVDISINVTSTAATTYNAFYAILNYDNDKFTYSGEDTVNDFSIEESAAGKLKISRLGTDATISTEPDLTLPFTAKAGGTGTFSLTGAKVDVASNAEQDAPEANCNTIVLVKSIADPSDIHQISFSENYNGMISFIPCRKTESGEIERNPSAQYFEGEKVYFAAVFDMSLDSFSYAQTQTSTYVTASGKEGNIPRPSFGSEKIKISETYSPFLWEFEMPNEDVEIHFNLVNPERFIKVIYETEHGSVSSEYGFYLVGDKVQLEWETQNGYILTDLSYTINGGDRQNIVNGTFSIPEMEGVVTVHAVFKPVTEPELIHNAEEWCDFADSVNTKGLSTLGKKYVLANDIDLSEAQWRSLNSFAGELDGEGHTIKGLDQSLILISDSGTIKNLKLSGQINYPENNYQDIPTDGRSYFGSFVNLSRGKSRIENCVSDISIVTDINEAVGGLVGNIDGSAKLINCKNHGSIRSTSEFTGGVLGAVGAWQTDAEAELINCYNDGSVTSTEKEGSVNAAVHVGGLVGFSSGKQLLISDSGNYAGVVSENTAGGLVAYVDYYKNEGTTIRRSLNKGAVSVIAPKNTFDVSGGGLIGHSQGFVAGTNDGILIDSCYNAGSVSVVASELRDGMNYSAAGLSGIKDRGYVLDSPTGNPDDLNSFKDNIIIQNSYNSGTISVSDGDNTIIVPDTDETTVRNIGEIVPFKMLIGNPHTSFKEYIMTDRVVSLSNCMSKAEVTEKSPETAVKQLNVSDQTAFKVDANGMNKGQTPLLFWEDEIPDNDEYTVSFSVEGTESYDLKVYIDEAETQLAEPDDKGEFHLTSGTYSYEVTAKSCLPQKGKFTVSGKNLTVSVTLEQGDTVTFETTPLNAEVRVDGKGPVSSEQGRHTFVLKKGGSFTYSATAEGYVSVSHEFTASDGMVIPVTLEKAGWTPSEDQYIFGDGNEGKEHTITKAGTYRIGDGAVGVLTVDTDESVVLVGTGTAKSSMYEDLYINCSKAGAKLTLQDVFISNISGTADPKMTNLIGFTGKGNQLKFAGTNILDQDTNASGFALIHAPKGTELTVSGGTAYIYKREQGAGIGGNGSGNGGAGMTPETNGIIKLQDARLFMKSIKQGALIGAGANADQLEPEPIQIENSELYLITTARGSAIGGSAGSSRASSGTQVTIDSKSTVNINVDFSGSAIGGGGFDSGNDADGGTLIYEGGSVRAYIDENAVFSWRDFGVTKAGVNGNIGITATIQDKAGNPVYLMILDSSEITPSENGLYSVKEGNKDIYSGGLHKYKYVNETKEKGQQNQINYTIDNWNDLDDPNLYLYLTGEDHILDANGQEVKAAWDEETKTFNVTVEEAPQHVHKYGSNGFCPIDNAYNPDAQTYIVTSPEQLKSIADGVNTGDAFAGKTVTLGSALDLSSFDNWTPIGTATENHYLTITSQEDLNNAINEAPGGLLYDDHGNSYKKGTDKNMSFVESYQYYVVDGGLFSGTFDGADKEISHLNVTTDTGYAGLFGHVDGTVKNLKVSGSVTSTVKNGDFVGGVVGKLDEGGTIENVTSAVNVTAEAAYNVGGIVGFAGSKETAAEKPTLITGCANLGAVVGYSQVGGIAGENAGTISKCYNAGRIDGKKTGSKNGTAGIAGRNGNNNTAVEAAVIEYCYNTGEIGNSEMKWVGGITGFNNALSIVRNCYNTGTIHGTGQYQPLAGQNEGVKADNTGVFDSYYLDSTMTVDEAGYYGGYGSGCAAKTAAEMKADEFVFLLNNGAEAAFNKDSDSINSGWPVLKWQGGKEVQPGSEEADKTALNETIAATQAALEGTAVSTDGSDIAPEKDWVTRDVSDALSRALSDAKAVTEKQDATQDEVDAAKTALENALAVFTAAKKPGTKTEPSEEGLQTGEVSESTVWNGVDVDVSWYIGHENDTSYQIDTAAQLAGAAALINGLVNENCHVYINSTQYYPASWWNDMEHGFVLGSEEEEQTDSQNKSTAAYHFGIESFKGKTITLTEDLDMGGQQDANGIWSGPNYMPLGGQYLMKKNDSATKLSASFCGNFDGGGHYVRNIYCDRHCENGNYGDGQSVGFIGRLGVHDNDPEELRPTNPTVKDLGVSGYIHGNRSVGGIVGKTGKTTLNSGDDSTGSIISGCVNYATVQNTDAKGCGGIVGAFWNGGLMENCYNRGDVSSTYACPTAGIAGSNENTIRNTYNTGTIQASKENYAMAIGTNNGGAPVKVVTNSWYLDGTAPGGGYFGGSNKIDNSGAMTSEAMKTDDFVTTLGDAFAKDADNINNGYPILKWQVGTNPFPPKVDKEALENALKAAEEAKKDVAVSADGSNVEPTAQWVTEAVAAALNEAVEAAQNIVAKADATQEEIDAAKVALEKAIADFNASKKPGTKTDIPVADKTALKQAVEAAQTALDGTQVSTPDDSKALTPGTEWISSEVKKALEDAITAAQNINTKDDATQEEIDAAKAALDKALADFNGAKQTVGVPDTDLLKTVIETARQKLNQTAASEDGKDVDEGQLWATAAERKKLADAIDAAEAVMKAAAEKSQNDVDAAAAALYSAMEAFQPQDGLNHSKNCPSLAFSDLDVTAWYHEAVDYALNHDYYRGTSPTTFEPNGTMTRAMFVTVLSRMEGINEADYTDSSFTDVKAGSWYAAAVAWAAENKIVLGIGDGKFDPNGQVTREQMATILYRYAGFKKISTSGADRAKFDAFKDKDQVSGWAQEAMIWATSQEVIRGTGSGIEPKSNATRAQVAQLMMNFALRFEL